jgi:hypothetical protein
MFCGWQQLWPRVHTNMTIPPFWEVSKQEVHASPLQPPNPFATASPRAHIDKFQLHKVEKDA